MRGTGGGAEPGVAIQEESSGRQAQESRKPGKHLPWFLPLKSAL